MIEVVSSPIEVAVDIDVEVTVNMELQPFLSKSVKEPIHFLVIVREMTTKEVDEFI